jgi:phospholipid-binding lipoprotein MlaA
VVPSLARTGVENFFDNLGAPGRFVSNVLQLKGREASIELGKFMINSTWGVLGFGNLFAGNPETKIPKADLGLTLAHYGVGGGPYVVWPFIGSYTLRDSVGWAGGLFLDPVSYIQPFAASLGTRSYYMVNYTSFRIGDYESFKDASIDPYLATRNAYLQYRAEKVRE